MQSTKYTKPKSYENENQLRDILTNVVLGGVTVYCIINLGRGAVQLTIPEPAMITPGCTAEFQKNSNQNAWLNGVLPYVIILIIMWGLYNWTNPSLAAAIGLFATCIIPMIFGFIWGSSSSNISELCVLEAQKLQERQQE